jgi:hypothetical protein
MTSRASHRPTNWLDAFTTPQASQADFPVPQSITAKDQRIIAGCQKEILADLFRIAENDPQANALITRGLQGMRNTLDASNAFASSAAMPPSQRAQSQPAAVGLQDLAEPAVRPKAGRPGRGRIKSGGEPRTPKKRGRPAKNRPVQNHPVPESPVRCPPPTSTTATPDGKRRKREASQKKGDQK